MKRVAVAPINAADLPVVVSKSGAARRVLQADESTGGSTFLFDLPAGWRSPYANGKFEHHTAHEEIVNL
ncbi:MAG: hypothetical protein NZ518_11450, partial [Dehalococcoidia bacterium]|nr:hypothetical protein [Dehalococcoidia bacterium]